jgi:hypothetical protein
MYKHLTPLSACSHRLVAISLLILFTLPLFAQSSLEDKLKVTFTGDAQLETGSAYIGLEFHHNFPILQRVSLYYPVSNSVDLSNDFWKRDSSFIMAAALKTGDAIEWFNHQKYEFTSAPYFVSWYKKDNDKEVRITYNFLKNKPAYTATWELTNKKNSKETFELYTNLEANLKTSHSYKIKDKAYTGSETPDNKLFIYYPDPELQNVSLFSINKGESPVAFSTKSVLPQIPVSKNEWWSDNDLLLNNEILTKGNEGIPAFRYLYKKELAPNEKMTVVQIIGTGKINEVKSIAEYCSVNYKKEIADYKDYVLSYIKANQFTTGDNYLDKTVLWSNAILAVNKHYIDGTIQPMPCPAEYYFYFTHDVLLTDLAAVNFDLPRVKSDLSFIVDHADNNKVIPHAFYWQDSSFVTEYADSDNWNHFWFVIASSKYLLRSGDTQFLEKIYPVIQKSITMAMSNRHDDMMWAIRPDWWDIGRNYGPRAFMTILAAKSLREFIYISTLLNKNIDKLAEYEQAANDLEKGLNNKLWSPTQKYLINYFADGSLDSHYYIGSLLASHFDLLNNERKNELTETAGKVLLDSNIGVYNVFPMDFQKLIDYLKFAGNEAGDEYYYANGGIWPHGNTWYALSLMSAGKKKEAYDFIRKDMTLNGIMDGPNGQPAMYEVRTGKKDKNIYGRIDKPQFMWAAGWYMYSLYNLFAIKENNWNLELDPWLPDNLKTISFNLNINGSKALTTINGRGEFIRSIKIDGIEVKSAVVPSGLKNAKRVEIMLGTPQDPYLKEINSELKSIKYDRAKKIYSFTTDRKNISAVIISPLKPVSLNINGISRNDLLSTTKKGSVFIISITPIANDNNVSVQNGRGEVNFSVTF